MGGLCKEWNKMEVRCVEKIFLLFFEDWKNRPPGDLLCVL